jgi:hypothetical protein
VKANGIGITSALVTAKAQQENYENYDKDEGIFGLLHSDVRVSLSLTKSFS